MNKQISEWIQNVIGGTLMFLGFGALGICMVAVSLAIIIHKPNIDPMAIINILFFMGVTFLIGLIGFGLTIPGRKIHKTMDKALEESPWYIKWFKW